MKKLFSYFIASLLFCSLSFPATLMAQTQLVFSSIDNINTFAMIEEVLRQAYQRLQIDISVIPLPAKRALRSANTGLSDGEAARVKSIEKEYPNLIRIDVPIRIDPMHLYVRVGDEFSVNGWDSIPKSCVLGYRRGVKFAEYAVTEYSLRHSINTSEMVLFEQLNKELIDIVLASPIGAAKMIREQHIDNIVQLDPPIHVSYLYHYLHKKHRELVPAITRALQEMESEGKIQEIREQFDNSAK